MAQLKIDTANVTSVLENIRSESVKYQLAVDNFFKEIENLSDCWNGPDANKFILETLRQKNDFNKLKLIFEDYADAMQKLVMKIEKYDYFQG